MKLAIPKTGRPFLLFVLLLFFAGFCWCGCNQITASEPDGRQEPEVLGEPLLALEKDGIIWVANAAGKDVGQLNKEGKYYLGSWAPDGKKLSIFMSANQENNWMTGRVGVLNLKGNCKPVLGPERPLQGEVGSTAWMSAADLILADLNKLWIAHEKKHNWQAELFYASPNKDCERFWYPKKVPGRAAVSFWKTIPQGEGELVAASLLVLNRSEQQPQEVFQTKVWASGQLPVDVLWSPDGRYGLIYAQSALQDEEWWLLELSSGSKKPILNPDAADVQWLSAKDLVHMPHGYLQMPEYLVYDVEKGEDQSFTELPSWVSWIEVAPDGGSILLAKASDNVGQHEVGWDLYLMDANGQEVQKLKESVHDACWSP